MASTDSAWAATIGDASHPSGVTATISSGTTLNGGNASAISLGNYATIYIAAGASVLNSATSGGGFWSAGQNVIEFDSFGTLTVEAGASVRALGAASNAEAINLIGHGNTIINRGLISGWNSAAIWFEDRTLGSNTIDNYGTIQSGNGSASTKNVIGNQSNSNVTFINRTGAIVYGSLSFAGGNDQLTLFPGSIISGGFNGGGGTNSLTLEGAAGSSDTLPGSISNFQSLIKTGEGKWTLTGANTYAGGTTIANGTLQLGNGGTTGSILGDVTDNGTLAFRRSDSVTFDSLISGTGNVVQNGTGVTYLTGANTYQGTTTINSGWLYINGTQTGNGTLTANSGTRLGGDGTYGGNVVITSGATLAPGAVPQTPATLTINGNLTLNATSNLFYNMIQADTAGGQLNDLAQVNGNLVLDGVINIYDQGQNLGPGVYRVINYTGTLTPTTGWTSAAT